MRHSQQDILNLLTFEDTAQVVLREGDTAWWPVPFDLRGPGVVTYLLAGDPYAYAGISAHFDSVADTDDDRCEYVNVAGDQCMLIDGDHGKTHFFEED